MKLYAYHTPDIPKHDGYLKIGETNGSVEERVKQQGRELDIEKNVAWQDAVITERTSIDKRLRRFLKEQGFQVRQFGTGHDTEWVKCTVGDIERAFEIVKRQIYDEEKQREEVGNQFYLEIRNWFYWTTQDNHSIDADYALRLVIRLLFCFFLREKNELVPKELLDQSIEKYLKSDEEHSYYKGILRNLFFHSINTPDNRKYENEKLLVDKKNVRGWFSAIPFLNGGLFDEHEKDDIPIGNDYFFSEKRERHLTELGETCDVYGIITILSKYQYKLSLDDLLDQAEYGKTVDPEFIGKVFESLLACIDTDSKATRRKITGSYYTPREIVDYMVSEALDAYLETIPLSLWERDGVRAFTAPNTPHPSPLPEGEGTAEYLLQCRILDPACGSGAFPCGIMNEIMRRLDPHRTLSTLDRYRKKLKIVQEVIYGVDIQPMAVQITLLRFFLSLIQEIVPDKQKANYGIDPLPNLETKFVCADALIGLKKEKQRKFESPIVKSTLKNLLKIRSQYTTASTPHEKRNLQELDESTRTMLAIAMEECGEWKRDTAELVRDWNPYSQMKSAPFFDPQWMFGVSEGFDIVIGNPPYVESRCASVSAKLKKAYQNQVQLDFGSLSQYITKGSDLLIYFFPRSITLLSEDGIGMLIVQNGWLNTDYGAKASKFLVKTLQYVRVIDSPFRHFDRASANINTVITQFKKQSKEKKIYFDTMRKNGGTIVTQQGKSFDLKNSTLFDMKWGMILATDSASFSILKKVIEKGKTLYQSFYTVGQGINVSKNTFIPKHERPKFEQKTNIINAVFKEYQYTYSRFSYFLYHPFKPSDSDISVLKTINVEEFGNGEFTRQYPSIIMPRGVGSLHFAGLLNGKALSNSFVDVYVNTQDEEKKLNVWLFCNSSLFFLYRELSGRKNLGGGLLKSEAADIKQFPLYFPIADKETILSIESEMGKPVSLPNRLEMSVQKKIDDLVFSYFEIDPESQANIISELLRLFRLRCEKAKTVVTKKTGKN